MRPRLLIFGWLLVLTVGCSNEKFISLNELSKYPLDESNGLYKKIERNGVIIEVIYKPTDLILAQEIDDAGYSKNQIDSIKKKLDHFHYFTIRLSRNGKEMTNTFVSDPEKLQQAADYLSFRIGSDLKLIHGNDTIPTTDFMHMRTFSASSTSDVLAAYKYSINLKGNVSILFDDNFFNTGVNRFDFRASDIGSIPSLDLNQISL